MVGHPAVFLAGLIAYCSLGINAGQGQDFWHQTNGPYGGRVNALAVSGTNIFAEIQGGGVWRRALSEMNLPILTTNSASSITSTSAILNGSARPKGLAATAYFEWGRDTTSFVTATAQGIGLGIRDPSVATNPTGLEWRDNFGATPADQTVCSFGAIFVTKTVGSRWR